MLTTWKKTRIPLEPVISPVLQRAAMATAPVKDSPPAVDHALRLPGHPLDAATRSYMEPRFGYDFSGVQVHTDGKAAESARSVNALAYTIGHDIVFGAGQYTPQSGEGQRLLAHELTHVVQQNGASSLQTSRIGPTNDRYELEAERTAQQVAEGKSAALLPSNSVPLVQRQLGPGNSGVPNVGGITKSLTENAVSRSDCEAALADFLRQAQQAQGGRSLQVTPAIRTVLQKLANLDDPGYTGSGGDPQRGFRLSRLDSWLAKGFPSSDPAEFAHQFASILPDPCSAEALRILGKAPKTDPTPGKLERVGDLIKKSAPAEKSEDQKKLDEQRQPTSTERFEQFEEDQRRRSGNPEKKIGPIPLDITRAIRIFGGLSDTLKGPKQPKPQPVELPPEVYKAAAQLDKNLLTPPGGNPNDSADVQELAIGLARELDSSYRQGQNQAVLDLGNMYANVKDRERVFSGISQIAEKMRQALPHHAPGVRSVNVVIGGQVVRLLPLAPIQSEEKK
jgi:hypothetical protein